MLSVQPRELMRKSLTRAAFSGGNLVSGALSLAASAALWNPLPLILWGLGSTAWVVFASSSEKYRQQILDEECAAGEARDLEKRARLREGAELQLSRPPIRDWIRSGQLPDYLAQYRRLESARDRVALLAHQRPEIELATEQGMGSQMSYMLAAYLDFVRARITYLQILANLRPIETAEETVSESPGVKEPGPRPESPRWRKKAQETPPRSPASPLPYPRVEERLAALDRRIKELVDLAQKEPATAETRRWHVDILKKQREHLSQLGERDQVVAAQLAAFPDAFDAIFARLSASEFNHKEVVGYLGGMVHQVEETERFMAELGPAVEAMMREPEPLSELGR